MICGLVLMYTLGIDAFTSRKEKSGVEWYMYHLLRAMEPLTPPEWRVFLYSLATNYFTTGESAGGRLHFVPADGGGESFTNDTNHQWQWKQLRWFPKRGWGQVRLSWEMLRRPPNVLFVPGAMIPFVHPHRPWRSAWTVTTIHDIGFLAHPELYRPADGRRQELALSFAMHHAALIFVPSEATRAALAKHIHRPERIVVTPLGVDHHRYRPESDQSAIRTVLEKYKLTEPYLLYVGRIDAKKNLPFLIHTYRNWIETKMVRSDQKCSLVLVGREGVGSERVFGTIHDLELDRRVRLLGYVPEEDLPALYQGARAFVFPSAAEGFGLPVLQALACGTPTLASDIPALREVAGEAALFVDPEDVSGSTSALQQITTDEALRTRLEKAGPARAQVFSWERTADLTWQAIRSLVG